MRIIYIDIEVGERKGIVFLKINFLSIRVLENVKSFFVVFLCFI